MCNKCWSSTELCLVLDAVGCLQSAVVVRARVSDTVCVCVSEGGREGGREGETTLRCETLWLTGSETSGQYLESNTRSHYPHFLTHLRQKQKTKQKEKSKPQRNKRKLNETKGEVSESVTGGRWDLRASGCSSAHRRSLRSVQVVCIVEVK